MVSKPKDKNVIGNKCVFQNKLDGDGKFERNKERLVCKGYTHIEGIDFDETYTFVAIMEAIWMFLVFAAFKDFKFY